MKNYAQLCLALILAGLNHVNVEAELTLVTGFVKREVYQNINGTAVADLTASQKFIDNQPDTVLFPGSFEAPENVGDNYGQRMSGLLIPRATWELL